MRRHITLAALLAVLLTAGQAAPTTTVCAAQARTQTSWPGRVVIVTAATCPDGGRAYVRFVSRTGSQPDSPPGYFTLQRGQTLTRRVPRDWWVEYRDKYLRWTRIKEVVR